MEKLCTKCFIEQNGIDLGSFKFLFGDSVYRKVTRLSLISILLIRRWHNSIAKEKNIRMRF